MVISVLRVMSLGKLEGNLREIKFGRATTAMSCSIITTSLDHAESQPSQRPALLPPLEAARREAEPSGYSSAKAAGTWLAGPDTCRSKVRQP